MTVPSTHRKRRSCALGSQFFVLSSQLSMISLIGLAGCSKPSVEQVETSATVPVAVEIAREDMLRSTIAASGTIVPAPGAELTVVAPAPARIAEMPKSEGDIVHEGDVLVRFDIPNLAADLAARHASVAQASARIDALKASFTRLSALQAQGVAASREVEDAKRQQLEAEADLEQAKSGVDAASALSDRAIVRARFAGVVAKRFHNPGDLVDASASDPVLKVINPAALLLVAAVAVSDLPRVVPGHAAEVRVPGQEARDAATVLTRAVQVDPGSATAEVRLAFAKPTHLAAGTTVQVDIIGEEHAKALVIPSAAIVRDEGETFVMVASKDNKAHKYPVVIGLTSSSLVEITSGLKAGDLVIVRGQDGLPEGATVAVVK